MFGTLLSLVEWLEMNREQHLGKRAGSVDNELVIPGRTLVNLGGRYRFDLRRMPATLRLQPTAS